MKWRGHIVRFLMALAAGSGLVGPATAQDDGALSADLARTANSALSISISGQIIDEDRGYYVLQSAGGRTRIELAGWPRDLPDDRPIFGIGDNVTAMGPLTGDFLAGRTLQAAAVYVEDRRAYFILERKGPEKASAVPSLPPAGGGAADDSPALVAGPILGVEANGFVLAAGGAELPVDTDSLRYNPYDAVGEQQLQTGNMVLVSGFLDRGAEEGPVMRAKSVTTILVVRAGV